MSLKYQKTLHLHIFTESSIQNAKAIAEKGIFLFIKPNVKNKNLSKTN